MFPSLSAATGSDSASRPARCCWSPASSRPACRSARAARPRSRSRPIRPRRRGRSRSRPRLRLLDARDDRQRAGHAQARQRRARGAPRPAAAAQGRRHARPALRRLPERRRGRTPLHHGRGRRRRDRPERRGRGHRQSDTPGQYVLACFLPSPDGTPHLVKGMVKLLKVTAEESGAAAPVAHGTVTLKDFAFEVPVFHGGRGTYRVVNQGSRSTSSWSSDWRPARRPSTRPGSSRPRPARRPSSRWRDERPRPGPQRLRDARPDSRRLRRDLPGPRPRPAARRTSTSGWSRRSRFASDPDRGLAGDYPPGPFFFVGRHRRRVGEATTASGAGARSPRPARPPT